MRRSTTFGTLGVLTALLTPTTLAAQTARERDLETRVQQLEEALLALRLQMQPSTSDPVVADAGASPRSEIAPPAPVKFAPAKPAPPIERASGTQGDETQIKLSGFVRVNMIGSRSDAGEMPVGALGREFYLPQQIPVGRDFASNSLLLSARQTRLAVDVAKALPAGEIKAHVEFDFALAAAPVGAQRATNPYTPTFRRGFVQYGGLLIGQEWTTFQNVSVLPETTDFVGPIEGTVFARQALIQYRLPLSSSLDLLMAVENPETETISAAAPIMGDNDDDRLPDLVARLNARTAFGEFSLAGLARELRVQDEGLAISTFAWGASLAGRVPFGPKKRHDIRFMATYGQGIGRYLGLGFAPDAFRTADRLAPIDNLAGFVAVKLGWTDKLRSTVTYSLQEAEYPDFAPETANMRAESLAGNLFWTPIDKFDLGIEYRRGYRSVLSGAEGRLDRIEFAAKYGF
ncbi:DcaP family trimeric outer membrane transporter [Novosphingobium sp. RD2P27]|uniref:DcaP family trimeric outer membrane transporter n=1 Tax=Novosphingobium kalidii TaxID=3230299 RepID=A0ABV2CX47_9SPHN